MLQAPIQKPKVWIGNLLGRKKTVLTMEKAILTKNNQWDMIERKISNETVKETSTGMRVEIMDEIKQEPQEESVEET